MLARLGRGGKFAGSALVIHGVVFALFFAIAPSEPDSLTLSRPTERVEVRVIDIPLPEPEAVEGAEVAPAPAPKAAPTQEVPPAAEPPADPVDRPKAQESTPDTPPVEPEQPRRRIVGLSFESTVVGGNGPAFAVGNTRMGTTGRRAAEPTDIQKTRPASDTARTGANRAATRLPAAGTTVEKPKRVGNVKPRYPELLRARGIEADVVVTITVAANGTVDEVTIVRGATQPEFDEAARQAALRQKFRPATRAGEPVPYTLEYTYRFRLDDV